MDTSIALRFGKVVSALEVITKQTDNENLKLKEMLEAERDAKQKVVSSYAAANCEWEYKPYDTVRKDVAAIIQSLEKIAVSSAHLKLVRDGAQARLKLVRDGAPLSPPRKRASEVALLTSKFSKISAAVDVIAFQVAQEHIKLRGLLDAERSLLQSTKPSTSLMRSRIVWSM